MLTESVSVHPIESITVYTCVPAGRPEPLIIPQSTELGPTFPVIVITAVPFVSPLHTAFVVAAEAIRPEVTSTSNEQEPELPETSVTV